MRSLAWEDLLDALVDGVPGRGVGRLRNQALVALLGGSGVTVAEAVATSVADIDAARCEVRIRRGRPRRVPVLPRALDIVATWIARAGGARRGPLFRTSEGGRLQESYVRRLLATTGERAGIDGVNARFLRGVFVREQIGRGRTPQQVAAMLGHRTSRGVARTLLDNPPPPVPSLSVEAMRALLEVAPCGLIAVRANRDEAGVIEDFAVVYLNRAAAHRLGVDAEAARGESVAAIAPDAPLRDVYARWKEVIDTQGETSDERRSGGRDRVTRRALGDLVVLGFGPPTRGDRQTPR